MTWSLTLPPTENSLTLPDLPSDVQAWFDRNSIDSDETHIIAGDVASTNGYDEYLIFAARTADFVSQSVTVDSDAVIHTLEETNNNGNNNTGGETLYGTLTFTGSAVDNSTFPSTYEPTTSTNFQVIAWSDDTVVLTVQPFSGNAFSAQLSKSDGTTLIWTANAPGLGGIPGITIDTSSMTFTDAVVSNLTEGTSVTINGTLSY